jgi:hypothetical protein
MIGSSLRPSLRTPNGAVATATLQIFKNEAGVAVTIARGRITDRIAKYSKNDSARVSAYNSCLIVLEVKLPSRYGDGMVMFAVVTGVPRAGASRGFPEYSAKHEP